MGTFWGLLNVALGASYAQVGMDIVDKMWVQFRMGSLDFIMFWGEYILGECTFLETFWIWISYAPQMVWAGGNKQKRHIHFLFSRAGGG